MSFTSFTIPWEPPVWIVAYAVARARGSSADGAIKEADAVVKAWRERAAPLEGR